MSIEIFGLNETVGNRRLKMPEDAFGGTYQTISGSSARQPDVPSGPWPSAAGIPTFANETLAKVAKPTAGTMTYEIANKKLWIYDGTDWKSVALSP